MRLSQKKLIKLLEHARQKIVGGWSREHTASDGRDKPVAYDGRRAKRFSLPGALHHAEHQLKLTLPSQGLGDVFHFVGRFTSPDGLMRFNECAKGPEQVLALIDEAIQAARDLPADAKQKEEAEA